MASARKGTETSAFGVSRRESHDSSGFYDRFTLPTVSDDETINTNPAEVLDKIYVGDSRKMVHLKDNSVALVVTSPPYFAGKEYEASPGEGGSPSTYVDYLNLLLEVFSECKRVLEPGGRIAVNVANLGRRPYRSLAADVIQILQDKVGFLLRGEIVWIKGQASSGSCAWGSYGSPVNPVLRDVTERIIVASKGRFDRPVSRKERRRKGLPWDSTIRKDEFLEFTQDTWEFPPESAHRVNHPAPFPVELPQRLIQLYTYKADVVVDPFVGSGSTAVAAVQSDRRFVGYDLDETYVDRARERVAEARDARPEALELPALTRPSGTLNLNPTEFQRRATEEGRRAKEIARELLDSVGFTIVQDKYRLRNGVEINFLATDRTGKQWMFDVTGAFTSSRPGLRRTDTLWKALGKAAVIRKMRRSTPLVLLTTDLPERGSAGYLALESTRDVLYFDAIEMFSRVGQRRLRRYAKGRRTPIGDLLVPE